MDSFRVKHVVNEVAASLEQHGALPNYKAQARETCKEVAVLLLEGKAGYDRLNVSITADDHKSLRTGAARAEHAVSTAAARWNAKRASLGEVGFDLDPSGLARFVHDIMTDYEVYFEAHKGRVAASAGHYRDVDAILDANVDVQGLGEPHEMAPMPLSDGRVGCARCGKATADMGELKAHHKATHRNVAPGTCTRCGWSKKGRPSDLHDHLRSAHDVYPAGHAQAFSTDVNHIKRKARPLLRSLLAEDRATLAALGGPPPTDRDIPRGWNQERLATEIRRVRMQIKHQPGWQAVVDGKRADRIAQ